MGSVPSPEGETLQKQVSDLSQALTTFKNTQVVLDSVALAELKLEFEEKCEELQVKFNLIAQALGVFEQKFESHDSRITMNMAKTLADNMKIGGVVEVENENPFTMAQAFFENIMELSPSRGMLLKHPE